MRRYFGRGDEVTSRVTWRASYSRIHLRAGRRVQETQSGILFCAVITCSRFQWRALFTRTYELTRNFGIQIFLFRNILFKQHLLFLDQLYQEHQKLYENMVIFDGVGILKGRLKRKVPLWRKYVTQGIIFKEIIFILKDIFSRKWCFGPCRIKKRWICSAMNKSMFCTLIY